MTTAAPVGRWADELVPLLVPLGTFSEDPLNARGHPASSVDATAASLRTFGQVKPIVHALGVVVAGHATLRAARRLGWTHLAAVETDLSGADVDAYGIADNRTAELSTWDRPRLAAVVAELKPTDAPLTQAMGFGADELASLEASHAALSRDLERRPKEPASSSAASTTVTVAPSGPDPLDAAITRDPPKDPAFAVQRVAITLPTPADRARWRRFVADVLAGSDEEHEFLGGAVAAYLLQVTGA